jgi:hypothetical protein
MRPAALTWSMTWAEDRALLRSNLSADPGVGSEGAPAFLAPVRRCFLPSLSTPSEKPDASIPTTQPPTGLPQVASANGRRFQFTVNQDRIVSIGLKPSIRYDYFD